MTWWKPIVQAGVILVLALALVVAVALMWRWLGGGS